MPLLEYRALLLDYSDVVGEPEPEPVPITRGAPAVLPRPEPLPVTWSISGGAHLRIRAGGTISIRRAPDLIELVLLDII